MLTIENLFTVINNSGHNYCLTQHPTEIIKKKCIGVDAENSRNSMGVLAKKKMNKIGRLQQSLKNNATTLKLSETISIVKKSRRKKYYF